MYLFYIFFGIGESCDVQDSYKNKMKEKERERERERERNFFRVNYSDDDRGESFSTSTLAFYFSIKFSTLETNKISEGDS